MGGGGSVSRQIENGFSARASTGCVSNGPADAWVAISGIRGILSELMRIAYLC